MSIRCELSYVAYRCLGKTRAYEPAAQFDEQIHTNGPGPSNPEELLFKNADGRLVERALRVLPVRLREILVLRELDGLSYKEIAEVMGVPMGTVMSTLSRARDRFRHVAADLVKTQLSSKADLPTSKSHECVSAGPWK